MKIGWKYDTVENFPSNSTSYPEGKENNEFGDIKLDNTLLTRDDFLDSLCNIKDGY